MDSGIYLPGDGGTTGDELKKACLLIARHYYGSEWVYEVFSRVNDRFFDGRLPWPHISWSLTPHGACLGHTWTGGPPVIVLHPSLLGGREKANPWEVPASWLGPAFAFDVLLHEAIHVAVTHCLGGWQGKGETSHNNDAWVSEVNRLAPLLGFEGVQAGRSRLRRVPIKGLSRTGRGRHPTRVARVADGNVPFSGVATFPRGLRSHLGLAGDFYRKGQLPL